MTDGMKSGAGSDPFGDESDGDSTSKGTDDIDQGEKETDSTRSDTGEQDTTSKARSPSTDTSTEVDQEGLPYIFSRSNVKSDRTMVQYFLREDTEQVETEVKHAVEQELGTDVLLTDIREALVRVGANHLDEVAGELRDWGYRYEEDSN